MNTYSCFFLLTIIFLMVEVIMFWFWNVNNYFKAPYKITNIVGALGLIFIFMKFGFRYYIHGSYGTDNFLILNSCLIPVFFFIWADSFMMSRRKI